METPDFIKKIDWSDLREQKRLLLETINNDAVSPEHKEALEGILSLIDAIQDYAVDKAQIARDIDVYDFELEDEREMENPVDKFLRESADAIFMELTESEFFHTDGEMPSEFIEKIMADDKHADIIKAKIREQILEDLNFNPTGFEYDDDKNPVYHANMRGDYEGLVTDYIRSIFNEGKTRQVWVCCNCGGQNVQTKYWVNPNTKEIFESISSEVEDCWCENCDELHPIELKEIPLK